MNKSIRSFLGPQSLDGILKPITDKADELAAFAQQNRQQAIDKRQQAETLMMEAEHLVKDAARTEEIARNLKGMI